MPAKKKPATIEDLLGKSARTTEVKVGSLTVKFTSIGSKQYDDLIAEHQPTKEQVKDGATWNPDTFPQALVAACSLEPKITEEDAEALFASETWSKGELMDMFLAVVKLNSEGLDVPFSGSA